MPALGTPRGWPPDTVCRWFASARMPPHFQKVSRIPEGRNLMCELSLGPEGGVNFSFLLCSISFGEHSSRCSRTFRHRQGAHVCGHSSPAWGVCVQQEHTTCSNTRPHQKPSCVAIPVVHGPSRRRPRWGAGTPGHGGGGRPSPSPASSRLGVRSAQNTRWSNLTEGEICQVCRSSQRR